MKEGLSKIVKNEMYKRLFIKFVTPKCKFFENDPHGHASLEPSLVLMKIIIKKIWIVLSITETRHCRVYDISELVLIENRKFIARYQWEKERKNFTKQSFHSLNHTFYNDIFIFLVHKIFLTGKHSVYQ